MDDTLVTFTIPVAEAICSRQPLCPHPHRPTTSASSTLEYNSTDKAIKLVAGADADKMSIDATPFIKDGMLSDVEYDAASNTLTFVWNTDSGLQADTVVLSDILDPYTAGDKIVIDGSKISHATIAAPALVEGGSGRTYITELVSDGFGHITGYKVATETVVDTNDNDTYSAGNGINVNIY